MRYLLNLLLRLLPCTFSAANMNRLQGGTVTLWLYKAADTDSITEMAASGYFNSFTDVIRQGDVIIAVDPGTSVDVLTVTSADNAATVTVANGT